MIDWIRKRLSILTYEERRTSDNIVNRRNSIYIFFPNLERMTFRILSISFIVSIFLTGCIVRKPAPFQCGYIFDKKEQIDEYYAPECEAINYQPGDSVAFIGASNGYRAAMLAMLVDSMHFFLQDIDSFCLNPNEVRNAWRYYENLNGEAFNCSYELIQGSESATHLPKGAMEKVVIMATFHHFSDTLGMLKDLSQVLRPGGRLYIIENTVKKSGDRIKRFCRHTLYTEDELLNLFQNNGFEVMSVNNLRKEFTKVFELRARQNPALDLQDG